jgi:hypothetical protein
MDTMEASKDLFKNKNSLTLERFNEISRGKKFSLEDVDWSTPIDKRRRWAPPAIVSLEYLPAFQKLPGLVQVRYNQLHALAICETFSLFEGEFLLPYLKNLLKSDLAKKSEAFQESMEHFLEEESKHAEMFWRLAEHAEPNLYKTRRRLFARTSLLNSFVLRALSFFPETLLVWVWIVIFFEERTLMYAKQYMGFAEKKPLFIETHFVKAHQIHYLEEIRHVRMDESLIQILYKNKPQWKRRLAARMMKGIIRGFTEPRKISSHILEHLKGEFPHIPDSQLQAVKDEMKGLRGIKAFQEVHFGEKSTERTRLCMSEFEEFKDIWDSVPL